MCVGMADMWVVKKICTYTIEYILREFILVKMQMCKYANLQNVEIPARLFLYLDFN